MLTILAILFAGLAFLSGIVVIGDGSHFQYTKRDILLGRDNALLYIWVTASTMFSMAHFAVLMDYGFHYNFGYKDDQTWVWMSIHAAVGILFVAAHLYIKQALADQSRSPRYLWGALSSVSSNV